MFAAYIRLAENENAQNNGQQEKSINDYAKANQFTVYEWFKDIISGTVKAENRPNYQYMKDKLQPGDTLIVAGLDRLGRDTDDIVKQFWK